MRRYSVSDEVWARVEPLFPRRGNRVDNRLFFDAVYWMAKSGAPWRDLPERFGNWNSVFSRFNRLAKAGLWQRIFEAAAGGEEPDQLLIDSSAVRVHQQAANGAKKAKLKPPLAAVAAD